MGWDIVMFSEALEDGTWAPADPLCRNPYHDPVKDPLEPEFVPPVMDLGRNSFLFDVLAGDGTSPFCKMCETRIEVISPTRGLPLDVCEPIRRYYDSDPENNCQASWLRLEEILEFDWAGKIVQKSAMVDKRVAHLFKDNPLGFPFADWPKEIDCGYAEFCMDGVDVHWRETYAADAGIEFVKQALEPYMNYPPRSVRFVFWFIY